MKYAAITYQNKDEFGRGAGQYIFSEFATEEKLIEWVAKNGHDEHRRPRYIKFTEIDVKIKGEISEKAEATDYSHLPTIRGLTGGSPDRLV